MVGAGCLAVGAGMHLALADSRGGPAVAPHGKTGVKRLVGNHLQPAIATSEARKSGQMAGLTLAVVPGREVLGAKEYKNFSAVLTVSKPIRLESFLPQSRGNPPSGARVAPNRPENVTLDLTYKVVDAGTGKEITAGKRAHNWPIVLNPAAPQTRGVLIAKPLPAGRYRLAVALSTRDGGNSLALATPFEFEVTDADYAADNNAAAASDVVVYAKPEQTSVATKRFAFKVIGIAKSGAGKAAVGNLLWVQLSEEQWKGWQTIQGFGYVYAKTATDASGKPVTMPYGRGRVPLFDAVRLDF